MFWLITLPFRLLFGILAALVALPVALVLLPFALLFWIPFVLLKLTVRFAVLVLALPLLLLAGIVGVLVAGAAAAFSFSALARIFLRWTTGEEQGKALFFHAAVFGIAFAIWWRDGWIHSVMGSHH